MPTGIYDSSLITKYIRDRNLYAWNCINRTLVQEGKSVRPEQHEPVSEEVLLNRVLGGVVNYRNGQEVVPFENIPCGAITQQIPPAPPILPGGAAQWATRITGLSEQQVYEYSNSIATDSQGNIYVIGYYYNNASVDSFVNVTSGQINTSSFGTLDISGSANTFLVKYNSNGLVLWATRLYSTNNIYGYSISVDSNDNVYVLCNISTDLSIDSFISGGSGGPIVTSRFGTIPSTGNPQLGLIKYNSSGQAQWATNIDNIYYIGGSITCDANDNIIVLSYAFNTFEPILNSFNTVTGGIINTTLYGTLPSGIGDDCYIVKYNSSGQVQWGTSISNINFSNQRGYKLSCDSNNNVYICGSFNSNVTFSNFVSGGGGGAITLSTFANMSSSGSYDGYIVKYNTSGTALWATRIGGIGYEEAYGISTDSVGNTYITGYSESAALTLSNYNSVSGGNIVLSTYGTLNCSPGGCFVIKYNTSGVAQWGTIIGNSFEIGFGIATDPVGNVYVTGQSGSTPSTTVYDFVSGGTGGAIALSTYGTMDISGSYDTFIVKYNTSGKAQWATSISGLNRDIGCNIAYSNGYVAVNGYTRSNPVSFNNFVSNTSGSIVLSSFGNLNITDLDDVFVAKYSA